MNGSMNVVFDLGGVIFTWNPDDVIGRSHEDETVREQLNHGLFRHPDWLELDRGALSYDEAFRRASERTGLPESTFRDAVTRAPEALQLREDTLQLLDEVRSRGHRTFVLSNMHDPIARILEERYDFWDRFEGIVFSCDVGAIKPDEAIYRHLLDTWSLDPAETVFLDDAQANVDGANALGISGILFLDAAGARPELVRMGVLEST